MADAERFAAAFEDTFARLREQVEAVCIEADRCEWPVRVARGVKAAFAFAFADPDAARLLTSEALTGGAESRARYQRLIAYFADLLRATREADSNERTRSDVADNAVAGGVALLVGQRLANGREGELPSAASEAVQFVLTPWLGTERARQIAREHC